MFNFLNLTFCNVLIIVLLSTLYSLAFLYPLQAQELDPPHDVQGCLSCHFASAFDEPNLIPGGSDPVYVNKCIGCHDPGSGNPSHLTGESLAKMEVHSNTTTSNKYGNWYVGFPDSISSKDQT